MAPINQLVCLALASFASAGHEHRSLRHNHGHDSESLTTLAKFKHRLRVCNAYPYNAALDVYAGTKEKLTGVEPMPYKTCRDFETPLKPGDKLNFKVGDASAGTFSVSDLPNNDAIMLLVIHRHDTLSTAVSFESHIFANLLNAQVAVIDTYKGVVKAKLRITDPDGGDGPKTEELRYNSVVALNQGTYDVSLANPTGSELTKSGFVAVNRESYVILRTGVEAQQGDSYPEELVVFPQSDSALLQSAAVRAASVWLAPLLALAAALAY